MNRKATTGILIAAGVVGIATAALIWAWMRKQSEQSEMNKQEVVVAAVAIKPYTPITENMITVKRMDKDFLADRAATRKQDVVGKVTVDAYKESDQIRLTSLTTKDRAPGLAYVIPEGKRALTIRVDDVKGVGYSVHPGDRADILATYRDPVSGQQMTQIILQRLEVLAIDEAKMDTAKGDKGATKCVTFAVTPEEAAKLTVTDMEGALRMVLRSAADKSLVDQPAIKLRDLVKPTVVPEARPEDLLQPPTGPVVIGEKEPRKIRMIRGSEPAKELTVPE